MGSIQEQFKAVDQLPIFEIGVLNKKTNENCFIIFNISTEDGKFIAQHEALNTEELESDKIAFKSIDIDEDFSLDVNLQELYSACIESIIGSEFYELAE